MISSNADDQLENHEDTSSLVSVAELARNQNGGEAAYIRRDRQQVRANIIKFYGGDDVRKEETVDVYWRSVAESSFGGNENSYEEIESRGTPISSFFIAAFLRCVS